MPPATRHCKDGTRTGPWDGPVSFDFLVFTFRARQSMGKHGRFTGFSPAASSAAIARISEAVRSGTCTARWTSPGTSSGTGSARSSQGWMALLRQVQEIRAVHPARQDQLPPPAMGQAQVPQATPDQGHGKGMGTGHHPVPRALPPLAMGNRRMALTTSQKARARRAWARLPLPEASRAHACPACPRQRFGISVQPPFTRQGAMPELAVARAQRAWFPRIG